MISAFRKIIWLGVQGEQHKHGYRETIKKVSNTTKLINMSGEMDSLGERLDLGDEGEKVGNVNDESFALGPWVYCDVLERMQ